jgi:hypothetical protein
VIQYFWWGEEMFVNSCMARSIISNLTDWAETIGLSGGGVKGVGGMKKLAGGVKMPTGLGKSLGWIGTVMLLASTGMVVTRKQVEAAATRGTGVIQVVHYLSPIPPYWIAQ